MADNSILAGRLTVDTSEFTRQITNAINDANRQIRNLGNTGGSGGGNNKNNPYAEQIKNVRELQQELKNLQRFMKDYNNALASGNQDGVKVFGDRVEKAAASIETLYEASKRLTKQTEESKEIHKKAAEIYYRYGNTVKAEMKKAQDAQDKAAESARKAAEQLGKQFNANLYRAQQEQIKQTADAYRNLKTAISEYQKAKKLGDTEGQAYWSEQINSSYQVLQNTKANIDDLSLESSQREKVLNIIKQGEGALKSFNASQQQSVTLTDNLAAQWTKMSGIIKMISGFSIYRVFADALSYAKDFDAALTDISIITGRTRAETDAMGESYRQMANNLRVSSTDIAKAAATIFRQGFTDPAQAQAVVTGATKFGAVTGQTTDKAIENMTAAIQNFRKEGEDIGAFVEHLGDVWSYMGDKVATTGEDISIAMAKTSASVDSVGVSMEKASAWAAIMLAKTQQGGQVIGTQLNSLVARYAKITSKGYEKVTSDDEGEALSCNDVSKALAQAGIELYDVASKAFLPMDEMMDQLANKWDTLDEATRKYIATTLGGTRGMNYLLTLLENYNDALELQAGIQDGMVNSKYAAWMQGVEAAQNNLTNSMQNLYSFMSSDLLVGFYNTMASIVDVFTAASGAVNGLNLKLPIVATVILTVVSAVSRLREVLTAGGGFLHMLSMGNIGLIVGSLFAVATAIGAIVSAIKNANRVDVAGLQSQIGENNNRISSLQSLIGEIEQFKDKAELSADEMERFVELRAAVVRDSPNLQYAYGQEGEAIKSYAELLGIANGEAERLVRNNAALKVQMYEQTRKDFLKGVAGVVGTRDTNFYNMRQAAASNPMLGANYDSTSRDNADLALTTYNNYLSSRMSSFNFANMPLAILEQFRDNLNAVKGSSEYANAEKDAVAVFDDLYDQIMRQVNAYLPTKQDEIRNKVEEFLSGFVGMLNVEDIVKIDQSSALSGLVDSFVSSLFDSDVILTDEGLKKAEDAFANTIFPLYQDILENGMSEANMLALAKSQEGLGFTKDNPFNKLILDWVDATKIANSLFDADLGTRLKNAIETEWTPAILSAFVGAINDIQNNPELGFRERNEALRGLIEKWVGSSIEDLEEISSSAATTGGPEEGGAEDIHKYAEEVRALIAETNDLQSALQSIKDSTPESPLDPEVVQKLVDAYPQLRDAFQAYAEAADEGGWGFLGAKDNLMAQIQEIIDNQAFWDGLDRIEQIREAMATLDEGNYDASFMKNLLETFEELEGLSPEEMFARLNEMLGEEIEQWGELARILGIAVDGYKSFADQVSETVRPMSAVEKAQKKLRDGERLSISDIKELHNLYPELSDDLIDYGRDTNNATKLLTNLNKAAASNAMNTWADSVESAIKKLDELEAGTREYNNAMVTLADSFDFQGLGTLSNLDFVTQNLDNIRAAAYGSADAFRALQEAAWINIIGSSDVDFSAVQNGLYAVDDAAIAAFNLLQSLGMGTVEYQDMSGYGQTLQPLPNGGYIVNNIPLNGRVAYWKPALANPLSGSGFKSGTSTGSSGGSGGSGGSGNRGGSGGGGGGSSTIKVSDATQTMLDTMNEGQDNFTNRLKLIQLKKEYHDIRGELQGVIGYTRLEANTVEEQNKILEQNIAQLAREIESKQSVIANSKSTSTAYKQAAKDLEELNKTHKEYTEKLQENINDLENLRKELEELEEQARQTVITVQDLIRDTLKGQKEYQRGILDGTVDLEDEIVSVLENRYKKEQELALDTANKKKELLQDEIDKIDELIDARRKLIEKEEKSSEIAELQAKIARISADPTRRRELMELQQQLAEKQKDQAWETYEEELQAQKDSLNEQMDNLDDYIEYVNDYYEDLFEHPQKLIAEMKDIIKQSDAEIIDWLKRNSDEWADYTDAKRQQTEEDWQEMINNMRGVTETYRDEVSEIMKWTDDEIMTWLKENNVEFQNATKEQQESFLYSWKESLNNWRNAYKSVVAEINATTYSSPSYSTGGGGSGGYSSGGGSSYVSGGSAYSAPAAVSTTPAYSTPSAGQSIFTATSQPQQARSYTGHATYYYLGGSGKRMQAPMQTATSTVSAVDAIKAAMQQALNVARRDAIASWQTYYKSKAGLAKDYASYYAAYMGINKNPPDSKYVWLGNAYKKGGIADFTGPAWLDGTPNQPERILSAEQTANFEDLLATLHAIHTVSVSGLRLPNGGDEENYSGNVNIEQIVIQPQSLVEDADYELIAERVGESIMDELKRTMVIGGIRI